MTRCFKNIKNREGKKRKGKQLFGQSVFFSVLTSGFTERSNVKVFDIETSYGVEFMNVLASNRRVEAFGRERTFALIFEAFWLFQGRA